MALRYVARSVGIPAARRVSPSTGSGGGPLASRFSQAVFLRTYAGYFNGAGAARKTDRWSSATTKNAEKEIEEVAEIRASFQAVREAIEHGRRIEKLKWCFFIGSGVAGVGLGLYAVSYMGCKAAEAVGR